MIMKKNSFCLLLIVTLLWLTSVPVCVKAESAGEDVAENREMEEEPGKIPVKVLILPKFEVGELTGDFPGEAQLYYENYLDGGEAYDIPGTAGESRLYVKDEVALFTLGMGKVRAGLNTMAVLKDPRFDFSAASRAFLVMS